MLKKIILTYIIFCIYLTHFSQVYSDNIRPDPTDSLKTLILQTKNIPQRIQLLFETGKEEVRSGNLNEAISLFRTSLNLCKQINDSLNSSMALYYLAKTYLMKNDKEQSIKFFELSIQLIGESDLPQKSLMFCDLANIYIDKAEYAKAIDLFASSIEIEKKTGNDNSIAISSRNIGVIYEILGNYPEALNLYKEALKIHYKNNNQEGIATTLQDIGVIYAIENNLDSAICYFEKSLTIYQKTDDIKGVCVAYDNIGQIFSLRKNYRKALDLYIKSYNLSDSLNYYKTMTSSCFKIAQIYQVWGKPVNSIEFYNQGINIASINNLIEREKEGYLLLSNLYDSLNDNKNAFENYEKYSILKDSIYNIETHEQINEQKTKFETKKKEQEIQLLNQEKKLNKLLLNNEKKAVKKRLIILVFVLIILFLFLMFSFIIYRQNNKKKKANLLLREKNRRIVMQKNQIIEQRDEIEIQRNEIEIQRNQALEQRDEIAKKKSEITRSIQFAENIQKAVLPEISILNELFHENFLIYMPKDIVSGDFYWFASVGNQKFVSVADCTGHGVPGAFMSMLGITLLNEIILRNRILYTNEILDNLKEKIIESLQQTGKSGSSKDGMDITICSIDQQNRKICFSGANNPIYILRSKMDIDTSHLNSDEESTEKSLLLEIKGDKIPIGYFFDNEKRFSQHEIKIFKGDILYLFSDGFADQFGGPENKKFKYSRFKDILINYSELPLNEQKEKITKSFDDWKNSDSNQYDQIDDVMIIGIKF
ncbi:MAG: tetratricopeptide repeat protein [Bacteroidota bacterium]